MPSAILFIDGSNFYHALRDMCRLPFDADEFRSLFGAISENYRLTNIIFYDAIKSSDRDPAGYSGQQRFHDRLKKCDARAVLRTRKLRYLANVNPDKIDKAARAAGIETVSNEKLMAFLVQMNLVRLTKEKGIDVQLVVDAVEAARARSAEAMMFLTGDADFVPAVILIRSFGMKTINLHLFRGSSSELRTACDEHILIAFGRDGLFLKPAMSGS